MTKICFYNGLREIGGTFVEVRTDKAKCMFDFGFAVAGRMDERIKKRKEDLAADYIRLGMLAPADGIYDKETAKKLDLAAYGETKEECFFLLSHMHIDHMGGLGMLDAHTPVYMSDQSLRLYRRLEAAGDIQERGHENCIGIPYGESFQVGDITVRVLAIDHDVVGAAGFLITTPDGTICYTGDYRFHGFHPEDTRAFAKSAAGADVLITEGVTVSFSDVDMLSLEEPAEERTEETLLTEMRDMAAAEDGLLVINLYNRNVERVHRLLETFEKAGRRLVLDSTLASYVEEFYPDDKLYVYERTAGEKHAENREIVSGQALLDHPEQYVLQLDYSDMYELIDLNDVVSRYVHMDGSPLGSYDTSYQKMLDLLEALEIPYEYKSLGGHATPYYLRWMVDTIAPDVLVPLHSERPEQVQSKKAGKQILPNYGDCYILRENDLKKEAEQKKENR
ncbi:MAG: hypothetical protein J6K53_02145 [Roseburia sp.]|nr:hypothetical protein [Roseburia sp.]